jgi:hypothetical protein
MSFVRTGLVLMLAAALLAGCQSAAPGRYVVPRVAGRVLDGTTHQPIPEARVSWLVTDEELRIVATPKSRGGVPAEVRTALDGSFEVPSERGWAPLRNPAWYSVTVTFERPGYESFTTTYTIAGATNTATGQPVVAAGDILLLPL